MRDRKLDKLFLRFRQLGDTAALAQVFDATAPELLGIAVHLVRDVGEGEDLVQQTFLTAIEKADRYEADRRLVPWMVGILVRHAHGLRRKRSRATTGTDLPEGESNDDPSGPLVASELADSIDSALAELPARYRDVLEPYLLQGARPVDIARERGKSPGTVRVQIRRGLKELRRALPAGLTLGTGVLVGGRSLADVRVHVLRHAAQSVGTTAALSATTISSTTLLGGLAMTHKLALAALALSLMVAAAWFATPEGGSLDPTTPELAAAPSTGADAGSDSIRDLQPIEPQVPRADEEVARFDLGSENEAATDPLAQNAGIHGLVVDDLGAPVPGLPVTLFQIRGDLFDTDLSVVFESPLEAGLRAARRQPVVARGTTDEHGRFELDGADAAGYHALGLGLGNGPSSLRILERRLRPRESTDLGTLALPAARRLEGKVLDAAGRPVVGARVRAGDFPEPAQLIAGWRKGSKLIYGAPRGGSGTFEMPLLVSNIIEALPVPTTTTDSDGRFTLEGAPTGATTLYVDHSDHDWIVVPAPSTQRDVGELALPGARPFQGRVVDATGAPVAGAQVRCGPGRPLEPGADDLLAVAHFEGTTNASGTFSFSSSGSPMVAARRADGLPWQVVTQFEDGQDVVLQLDAPLELNLTDRAGERILGAELHASPHGPLNRLEGLFGPTPPAGRVEELSEGTFRITGLLPTRYTLRARAPGFAPRSELVVIEPGGTRLEWSLDRAGTRRVKVLGLESREPVSDAHVTLRHNGSQGGLLAQARTDATGVATLSGVPTEGEARLLLIVTHGDFATERQDFERERTETTVEVSASNGALFTLSVLGSPPLEPLMVSMARSGGGLDSEMPWLELSDGQGQVRFDHLPAGTWSYRVTTRILDRNILSLLQAPPDIEALAHGRVEVRKGQLARVQVELPAESFEKSVIAETNGVEGHIRVRGIDGANLQISLVSQASLGLEDPDFQAVGVGTDGGYSFSDLKPGPYLLFVTSGLPGSEDIQQIASRKVNLTPKRMVREDFDLEGRGFTVNVLSEEGRPVTDARLTASSHYPGRDVSPAVRRTEEAGGFDVVAWGEGEIQLHVKSPTEGIGQRRVTLGSGAESFDVQLSRGVPCAGRLSLPEGAADGVGGFSVFNIAGEPLSLYGQLTFTGGVAEFDWVGLQPGPYQGSLGSESGDLFEFRFELAPGGDQGLHVEVLRQTFEAMPVQVIEAGK